MAARHRPPAGRRSAVGHAEGQPGSPREGGTAGGGGGREAGRNGMTDRERIVEVMEMLVPAGAVPRRAVAERILGALEADGFAIYRPDECSYTTVTAELKDGSGYCWFGYQPAGTYHLVPVGGDS